MAESPVSLYQGGGGGTLAQAVLASAPEGMLIAPVWKRVAAFMLDVMLISIVLSFLTNGDLTTHLLNFKLLTYGADHIFFFSMNWVILLTSHWLYWKYTGRSFGRSLGQRAFRIAIVHDNGTVLESHHWGPRAVGKLIYLAPVIGPLWFGMRDAFDARSKQAEYRTSIDKKNHTVAAVDWSLPVETRTKLR
tara:strand:+ start:8899 stop:9471 length:573 start_codon:yes stop_codon:yes gene_type:complete